MLLPRPNGAFATFGSGQQPNLAACYRFGSDSSNYFVYWRCIHFTLLPDTLLVVKHQASVSSNAVHALICK